MTGLLKDLDFELRTETQRVDTKKRLSISAAVKYEGASYNIYSNDHGQIVLDPVVSVPAGEAWLFKNKRALASVKRGLTQSATGRGKYLGSFAKYAKD